MLIIDHHRIPISRGPWYPAQPHGTAAREAEIDRRFAYLDERLEELARFGDATDHSSLPDDVEKKLRGELSGVSDEVARLDDTLSYWRDRYTSQRLLEIERQRAELGLRKLELAHLLSMKPERDFTAEERNAHVNELELIPLERERLVDIRAESRGRRLSLERQEQESSAARA